MGYAAQYVDTSAEGGKTFRRGKRFRHPWKLRPRNGRVQNETLKDGMVRVNPLKQRVLRPTPLLAGTTTQSIL